MSLIQSFKKLNRKAKLRKIDALADQAIAAAADAFESGEFGWVRGELLAGENGLGKSSNSDYGLKTAVKGCLLGGISKYAWVIVGKPAYATSGWELAKAVETRAYQRAFVGTLTIYGGTPHYLNDCAFVGGVSTIVQALRDSVGKDAESLPEVSLEVLGGRIENKSINPYTRSQSELLHSLYNGEPKDA